MVGRASAYAVAKIATEITMDNYAEDTGKSVKQAAAFCAVLQHCVEQYNEDHHDRIQMDRPRKRAEGAGEP